MQMTMYMTVFITKFIGSFSFACLLLLPPVYIAPVHLLPFEGVHFSQ